MPLDLASLVPEMDRDNTIPDCFYPEIAVTLIGENGNALNLMGIVRRALRKGDVDPDDMTEFLHEAMDGDYEHVLQTCVKWVTVQ